MSGTERKCETCRWWLDGRRWNDGSIAERTPANPFGECRIRAPHAMEQAFPGFPTSHPDDWCGEHTPKEPTT